MLIGHSQHAHQKGKVAGGDFGTLGSADAFGMFCCMGTTVESVQMLQK